MTDKERALKRKLNRLGKAIRRKYMALRRGKDDVTHFLTETFEPITTPLQKLVGRQIKPISEQGTQTSTYERTCETPPQSPTVLQRDDAVNEYINLLISQHKDIDRVYGVRYVNGSFVLGDTPIDFGNGMVVVGTPPHADSFPASVGLYELLFKKTPTHYTEATLNDYKRILMKTHVHREGNDPSQPVRSNRTFKKKHVIDRIFAHAGSGLTGWKNVLSPHCKADYKYWNDPNELVDRLRLLLASTHAGNDAHDNEISELLAELREDGYIQ